jgi:hypothetical protein
MSEKKLNGKPLSHWEAEAKKLVIDILVRAGTQYAPRPDRPVSLIHELASKQLLSLATGVDPRGAREASEELVRLDEGLQRALSGMLGR